MDRCERLGDEFKYPGTCNIYMEDLQVYIY